MKKSLYLVLFLLVCISAPQVAHSAIIEIGGSTTPPPNGGGPTIKAIMPQPAKS